MMEYTRGYVMTYEKKCIGIKLMKRTCKYLYVPGDTNEFAFIEIFTLKEYFLYLFEEPADTVTRLKIKQPGTYIIHFYLIGALLIHFFI